LYFANRSHLFRCCNSNFTRNYLPPFTKKKAFWTMTPCSLVGGYRPTRPQAFRLWYEETLSLKCVCNLRTVKLGRNGLLLSLEKDENKCDKDDERRRDWNERENQVPDFATDFFISTAAC
jgi:hypothetical protein